MDCSSYGQEGPPDGEEEVELLVPDISGEDAEEVGFCKPRRSALLPLSTSGRDWKYLKER